MAPALGAERVRDWKRRKAERAPDPLLGELGATEIGPTPPAAAVVRGGTERWVEACAGGTVVAAACEAECPTVNGRRYFPRASLRLAHFAASPKRWR